MKIDNRARLIAALHAHLEGDPLSLTDAEDVLWFLEADGERLAEKAAPMPQTRNSEALRSFAQTCADHPEWRFWQALRNWSGWSFVLLSTMPPHDLPVELRDKFIDTFYWEQQQGRKAGADE